MGRKWCWWFLVRDGLFRAARRCSSGHVTFKVLPLLGAPGFGKCTGTAESGQSNPAAFYHSSLIWKRQVGAQIECRFVSAQLRVSILHIPCQMAAKASRTLLLRSQKRQTELSRNLRALFIYLFFRFLSSAEFVKITLFGIQPHSDSNSLVGLSYTAKVPQRFH